MFTHLASARTVQRKNDYFRAYTILKIESYFYLLWSRSIFRIMSNKKKFHNVSWHCPQNVSKFPRRRNIQNMHRYDFMNKEKRSKVERFAQKSVNICYWWIHGMPETCVCFWSKNCHVVHCIQPYQQMPINNLKIYICLFIVNFSRIMVKRAATTKQMYGEKNRTE